MTPSNELGFQRCVEPIALPLVCSTVAVVQTHTCPPPGGIKISDSINMALSDSRYSIPVRPSVQASQRTRLRASCPGLEGSPIVFVVIGHKYFSPQRRRGRGAKLGTRGLLCVSAPLRL